MAKYKIKYCKDCHKKLTGHSNPKRCQHCAGKKNRTKQWRKMISKRNTGKGNGQYKTGKYMNIKRYCKKCHRLLKTRRNERHNKRLLGYGKKVTSWNKIRWGSI